MDTKLSCVWACFCVRSVSGERAAGCKGAAEGHGPHTPRVQHARTQLAAQGLRPPQRGAPQEAAG